MERQTFVKIGSRKGGRYYAKEEMNLEEFKLFLFQVAVEMVPDYDLEKPALWERILNTQAWRDYKDIMVAKRKHKLLRDYRDSITHHVWLIAQKDKPGKKVLK